MTGHSKPRIVSSFTRAVAFSDMCEIHTPFEMSGNRHAEKQVPIPLFYAGFEFNNVVGLTIRF